MGIDVTRRQPLDQGIDAGPGGGQARAQVVALGGHGGELLLQQGVGVLELVMALQQPFYAVGEVF